MAISVFDFRTDLANVAVSPQIRNRFRRVELGPVPEVHSHDLGGETFLVMEGTIEFTVSGETVVCEAGQGIYVPPRTTHAVRAIGAAPGVMYLSVSPHVEPTHTFYGADGSRLPPRYGVWQEAGGGSAPSDAARGQLLADYRAAAERLAELATANAANAATTRDEILATLMPLLQHVETLERTWNELALRDDA
jgi:mannose-6-phosphate isomerase-like protein (cupin superfamily)